MSELLRVGVSRVQMRYTVIHRDLAATSGGLAGCILRRGQVGDGAHPLAIAA